MLLGLLTNALATNRLAAGDDDLSFGVNPKDLDDAPSH
jgi:hypothetical protein